MDSQNFASRLRWIIETHLRMKPATFARRSGISASYLSELLNEKKEMPSPELLQRIASESNIRYEWLSQGAGDPVAKYSELDETAGVVKEDPFIMQQIREGPAGAARRMSDDELLEEIREQYQQSLAAKPYMKPAHKEILQTFFKELLSRIDEKS